MNISVIKLLYSISLYYIFLYYLILLCFIYIYCHLEPKFISNIANSNSLSDCESKLTVPKYNTDLNTRIQGRIKIQNYMY